MSFNAWSAWLISTWKRLTLPCNVLLSSAWHTLATPTAPSAPSSNVFHVNRPSTQLISTEAFYVPQLLVWATSLIPTAQNAWQMVAFNARLRFSSRLSALMFTVRQYYALHYSAISTAWSVSHLNVSHVKSTFTSFKWTQHSTVLLSNVRIGSTTSTAMSALPNSAFSVRQIFTFPHTTVVKSVSQIFVNKN